MAGHFRALHSVIACRRGRQALHLGHVTSDQKSVIERIQLLALGQLVRGAHLQRQTQLLSTPAKLLISLFPLPENLAAGQYVSQVDRGGLQQGAELELSCPNMVGV